MKIALLKWEDPYTISSGWDSKEAIVKHLQDEDFSISQVGYILDEQKDCYILAGKVNPTCEGEKYSEVSRIPKSCVKEIQYLTSSSSPP